VKAYGRGSTRKVLRMARDCRSRRLPRRPAMWIGGDCHAGQFGPLGDERGRVAQGVRPPADVCRQLPDKSVLIREVLPRICSSKSNSTRDEAMKATGYLAAVIGKAHERQLSTHEERRQEELKRIEQKRRTLPRGAGQASWSRKSFMRPEYLEPCRKYAMGSC
jgi:hypothetical protein